uniref:Phosphatidylinositol transfer protein membrane associated 1 n=1 Tax=Balaenoptera musculus TaxID=9771 RepID=A0A8C0CHD5_BALMU
MSYKPIAPAPSSTPGSSTPGPGTPVPTAGSVPSPSGSVPGAAAPFRPLFNDFGPPSMGYVQAMKPPGAQGSQSTYTDLLSVIEEMGKEIRPTYAGSKSAMERLKRGLRRVMLRAHRQAWCWQDEWTELSMADIRALEEETARMLAQRMAKCNSGSEGPEAQPPGKPSTEARAGASRAGTPDGPEAPPGPDASPDASFGKQWS